MEQIVEDEIVEVAKNACNFMHEMTVGLVEYLLISS